MSKLDRDITAVIDEIGAYAKPLMVQVIKWMAEDVDDIEERTVAYIKEHEPKQYDDYIRDIKRAFIDDGWTAPQKDVEDEPS